MRRRIAVAAWFAAGILAMAALGAYGASIAGGERGSFVMNFPATGTASGGPSVRALTGSITVDLDRTGPIKRLLQPNVVQIASHTITNVGDRPRSIRIETTGFPEACEWSSRDRSWDPATHTVRRVLAPREYVDLDLEVTFPRPLPAQRTLMNGRILVLDAETDEQLSSLAVRVVRSGAPAAAMTGGECCE